MRIFFGDDLNIQYNKHIAPHRNYMFNFALKLSRNRCQAEDITQQALIKAFVYSQNNAIDSRKIKSFLSSTLYNTFIDYKRRLKHRDDIEIKCSETPDGFTESYLESMEDSFNYDSLLDSIQINQYIQPVMEKLKQQPTLHDTLDYFIQEYSYEDIAKLMNTNIGNVKSRLYRARKFVKENISEEFLANI